MRYTMTAREAVDLCRLLRPRTVLPVHYEGWGHFHEGRQAAVLHLVDPRALLHLAITQTGDLHQSP